MAPLRFFLFVLAVMLFFAPERARAAEEPPLDTVLRSLAGHAARFEQIKARASYTLSGTMERVDGSGHVAETKEMVVKVNGPAAELVRYVEDGKDKTAAERAKRGNGRMSTGRLGRVRLPFLASEQPRYRFTIAERDARWPWRMRIAFVPLTPADDTFVGSAWVDANEGEVLTLRLSPTKKPRFVDDIDVSIHFESKTSLGRAPSRVTFEASGGFLFIRKRYRGVATISDAVVRP